jgi:cell division protein FtsB
MSILSEIRKRGRYALLPVMCALATTYFGYHMVHGEFGLLAYWRLNQEIATLQKEYDSVLATRRALDHRDGLLRPGRIDPDMVDERARESLGFVDPHDLIITGTKP